MNKVISLAAYKAEKGIVPPRSPYYTTNATEDQIAAAVDLTEEWFSKPIDYREKPPYAVVIGYADKKGRIRLLKSQIAFPSKRSFELMGGMATMETVAVIRDNGL